MTTRWGILGAGKISEDFVRAVSTLPDGEHKVVAIAARDHVRAREFADKLNIATAYGSYEALATASNLDVVYIGTIHPHHAEHCKLMLNGGKPVLCEKPFCMNQKEASEVLSLAKEKKLFIMEAFWSRCFPVYHKLREELRNGTIGEPRILNVQFGKILQNPRSHIPELGGGALYALGCYSVQMADLVFEDRPNKITVSGTLTSSGVDDTSVISLLYPGGEMAVLTTSASCVLNQRASIQGTKGIIEIPTWMWCPSEIVINQETSIYPLPEASKQLNFDRTQCMVYEAQHIREMLINGELESPLMTHTSTLRIASVIDEAREQLGLT